MKILVTGAAGFIGSALCPRLVSAGHDVVAYDNLSRGRREHLPSSVPLVEGDIRDQSKLGEAFRSARPDSVIHLAAMHFIPDCVARPAETLEVNVAGTRVVLDCCRRSAVGHVVFASSAAVYAPVEAACVEDSTPLGPLEIYGESKLAGEELVREYHADTDTAATILRLFNAMGRRETNPHVIPHIFESLRTSNTVRLGNIAPRRDYIDTRDVSDAVTAAAAASKGLHVLNVGTGVAHSVSDLVGSLSRLLGRRIDVVEDPVRVRATERMLLVADIDRIRRRLSWAPRISVDETLADLVDAYGLASSGEGRSRTAIQMPPNSTPTA